MFSNHLAKNKMCMVSMLMKPSKMCVDPLVQWVRALYRAGPIWPYCEKVLNLPKFSSIPPYR